MDLQFREMTDQVPSTECDVWKVPGTLRNEGMNARGMWEERKVDGWVLMGGCVNGWMDGQIDGWEGEEEGRGCGLEEGDLRPVAGSQDCCDGPAGRGKVA